jgi:predicted TIM-barrel fold metal-dependent hydrolase
MTGKSMRCDSHVHVVGPVATYPQLATRTYLALPAPLEELSRNAAPSGVSRFVIVQPSFYGADNTMLLESLDALGSRGRGVAVVDPARTSKAMLDRYAARGVCGLRLNLYSPKGNSGGRLARDFSAVAAVAGAMGWHVEVIVPIAILAEAAGILGHAETTVVIDHYGVYGHSTPDSADGRALLDLVALPHVWMKLSAPYRVSDDPLNTRPDPACSRPSWIAGGSAASGAAIGRTRPATTPSTAPKSPACTGPSPTPGWSTISSARSAPTSSAR